MESIRELLDFIKTEYKDLPALKWPDKGLVNQKTYEELVESAMQIRKGLSAEGFSGNNLAIIGFSSCSWLEAFFSITSGNNTAVLLDPLLPSNDLTELLIRSDSRAVFLDSSKINLISDIRKECPLVEKIYLLDDGDDQSEEYKNLSYLRKAGIDAEDVTGNGGDALSMIIFNSGTTGMSK